MGGKSTLFGGFMAYRRETEAEERDRYGSASEASDPSKSHSGSWDKSREQTYRSPKDRDRDRDSGSSSSRWKSKAQREKEEREAKKRREAEAKAKKDKERKDRGLREAERLRYEQAAEASNPSLGHSEAWGVRSYRSQAEANRSEQARRDREKRERDRDRKSQREEFRRIAAADKLSGGKGGTTEYGRAITDSEIDMQLEKDAYSNAADNAWSSGNYGDWLTNKMASTALGFTNDVITEFNDFSDAPLDYTSDVLRNPSLGAALAVFAPQVAMGAAGVKAADSVMDYFQDEATGKEALQQGALDLAGTIQNQGIATMARFLGDPTGTTGRGFGTGVALATGGGVLGATLGAVTPGVLGKVTDKSVKEASMLSPKERRAIREQQAARRQTFGEDKSGEDFGLVRVGGKSIGKGDTVTASSGRRSLYSPSQDWMVDPMEIYGVQDMEEITPSDSTKGLANDKISTKQNKALTLVEQYPWLFDQGVLSGGTNPYAVTS